MARMAFLAYHPHQTFNSSPIPALQLPKMPPLFPLPHATEHRHYDHSVAFLCDAFWLQQMALCPLLHHTKHFKQSSSCRHCHRQHAATFYRLLCTMQACVYSSRLYSLTRLSAPCEFIVPIIWGPMTSTDAFVSTIWFSRRLYIDHSTFSSFSL